MSHLVRVEARYKCHKSGKNTIQEDLKKSVSTFTWKKPEKASNEGRCLRPAAPVTF